MHGPRPQGRLIQHRLPGHKSHGVLTNVVVSGSETWPTVLSRLSTRDCAGTTSYWKHCWSDTALAKTNNKIMP